MATIVGPETSNTPYFTLITTLDPDDLAKASTLLLSAVEARPKLTQAFRLEVKFLQENAQFQICLDPVLWYDVYLRVNPRLDEAVRIAREYVTSIRTQILPEEDGPFVVEYDEIEKDKAFIPCNKIYLIINPNVGLVQRSEFWRDLIEQRQRLNFHSIAVNYGRWETGQSRDKYAQACHAHVHLLFDREAWEGVKGIVTNKITLSKLNTRNYPGPNYLLKDCTELEQQRLQLAEHQYMLASITKLSVSVENSNKSLIDAISSLTVAINSLNRLVEDKDKKEYYNQ
ncbi:13632_t:CDS:2 [Rhizophagus irregularis]|nr:13632_t:CDS:2 [Rhizophagus irregularis]